MGCVPHCALPGACARDPHVLQVDSGDAAVSTPHFVREHTAARVRAHLRPTLTLRFLVKPVLGEVPPRVAITGHEVGRATDAAVAGDQGGGGSVTCILEEGKRECPLGHRKAGLPCT
jgi:hypothetical protein